MVHLSIDLPTGQKATRQQLSAFFLENQVTLPCQHGFISLSNTLYYTGITRNLLAG